MKKVEGTVRETLLVKKEVVVEVEDNASPEHVEQALREEALKKLIIDDGHGWKIEFSDGIDAEVEREWTEDPDVDKIKVNGIEFCSLPHQPYVAWLGRFAAYVSHNPRRGKETPNGHETDSVWYVNVRRTLPNGESKNIQHMEVLVEEGREEEAKRNAFERAAEQLRAVQESKD